MYGLSPVVPTKSLQILSSRWCDTTGTQTLEGFICLEIYFNNNNNSIMITICIITATELLSFSRNARTKTSLLWLCLALVHFSYFCWKSLCSIFGTGNTKKHNLANPSNYFAVHFTISHDGELTRQNEKNKKEKKKKKKKKTGWRVKQYSALFCLICKLLVIFMLVITKDRFWLT